MNHVSEKISIPQYNNNIQDNPLILKSNDVDDRFVNENYANQGIPEHNNRLPPSHVIESLHINDPMISKQYSHTTNTQEGIRYDTRNYGTIYTQQLDGDIRSRIRTYFGAKVSNRYRHDNKVDANLVLSWIKWNIKKGLCPTLPEIHKFLYTTAGIRSQELDPFYNYFRAPRDLDGLVTIMRSMIVSVQHQVPIRRDRKPSNNNSTWIDRIPMNEQNIIKNTDDVFLQDNPVHHNKRKARHQYDSSGYQRNKYTFSSDHNRRNITSCDNYNYNYNRGSGIQHNNYS